MSDMQYIMMDAGEVLSGRKSGVMVPGFSEPHPNTPDTCEEYTQPDWFFDLGLWITRLRTPLFLSGPTGCGKTLGLKQLVRKFNWPVYEVTGHSRLEMPELVGHYVVVNGNMQYEYGPLARAMKYGGLFLFNEIDLVDPAVLAGLNTVLDGSPLCIPELGGEVVKPHPAFFFAATANSTGEGDLSGIYTGVLRMNAAFMDRFFFVEADYLNAEQEIALMKKDFPLGASESDGFIDKLRKFGEFVRSAHKGESTDEKFSDPLSVTMSTRTMRRVAKLAYVMHPLAARGQNVPELALNKGFLNKVEPSIRVALSEVAQRIFGYAAKDGD